jgi:hypothetical protein
LTVTQNGTAVPQAEAGSLPDRNGTEGDDILSSLSGFDNIAGSRAMMLYAVSPEMIFCLKAMTTTG